MKKVLMIVAVQLATSTAAGFCFTLGASAWRKISEKTGVLKPEKEKA